MELVRRHTDYGIRALFELAGAGDGNVPCAEVADACGITKGFSYKVLQRLGNAGFVSSKPGRPGGFQLCKDLSAISLFDVVSALQGPVEISKCVRDGQACDRSKSCPLRTKWRELQGLVIDFLKQTTLQSVLTPAP